MTGTKGGKPATRTFELVDRYDEEHGISAMMRTTGYSLSITGLMQVGGQVTARASTRRTRRSRSRAYVAELGKRGKRGSGRDAE